MAKLKVMGDTIQIVTSIAAPLIQKAKAYKKEALQLVDEDGNAYFGIDFGPAHYSKGGVVFSSTDFSGCAFMTSNNPIVNEHNNQEYERTVITEEFAEILNNLNKVEAQVLEAINEILEIESSIQNSIEFTTDTNCTMFECCGACEESTEDCKNPEPNVPEEDK